MKRQNREVYTVSFHLFSTRYCTEISEKVVGKQVQSCIASAPPLYHYTSSHQAQLDSCRWHLVWRVWRLIEDVFDAGRIKSNTLAFQTGVLLFEVSGQCWEDQVCSDQFLLTFMARKKIIIEIVNVKMEFKTLPGNEDWLITSKIFPGIKYYRQH